MVLKIGSTSEGYDSCRQAQRDLGRGLAPVVGVGLGLALGVGLAPALGLKLALVAGLICGLGAALAGDGVGVPGGAGEFGMMLGTLGATPGVAVTTGTGEGLGAMQGAGMGEGGGFACKMIGVGGAVGLGDGEGVTSSSVPGRDGLAEAAGLVETDGLGTEAVVKSGCGAALTEMQGASRLNWLRAILPYGLPA